jgi:hypothetical protein
MVVLCRVTPALRGNQPPKKQSTFAATQTATASPFLPPGSMLKIAPFYGAGFPRWSDTGSSEAHARRPRGEPDVA